MAEILLMEDEADIREAVREYLTLADHTVTGVGDGNAALAAAGPFDLHILDVRVPGPSGFEVAKAIRRRGDEAPIIFLTARDDEASRITGFELGADDYISKPFSPRELVLRVEAMLRRLRPDAHHPDRGEDTDRGLRSSVGERKLTLDREGHLVTVDGEAVSLTPTEWRVLDWFLSHPDQVITRDALLETVLGYGEATESRTADTHIKNLRAKLRSPDWIETVRGFGYRFGGGEVRPL